MEKTIKYLENGEYHYATVKDVGDLAKLKTDSKEDLVAAINELFANGGQSAGKPEGYDKLVKQLTDSIKEQQGIKDKLDQIEQTDDEKDKIRQKEIQELREKQAAERDRADLAYNKLVEQVEGTFHDIKEEHNKVRDELNQRVNELDQSLESTKTELGQTKTDMIQNADKLNLIDQKIVDTKAEVNKTNDALSTKVGRDELDIATGGIQKVQTEINQQADQIELLASKKSLDEISGLVQKNISNIKINSDNFEQMFDLVQTIDDKQTNLSTKVTTNAEGIKQVSSDIKQNKEKIEEYRGQLETTAHQLTINYEKYTNDAVGKITDSSVNQILNSGFTVGEDYLTSWQNVSDKVTIQEDGAGLRWARLIQSNQTSNNPIGLTSNFFVVKPGTITVSVDIKLGSTQKLDDKTVILLEGYDEKKKRVDFKEVALDDLRLSQDLLSNGERQRGIYKFGLDRTDVKYMTVKGQLLRNGDISFTNFSARLSSIDNGDYSPNADDLDRQIIKMNTSIEQNANEISLKANSVEVDHKVQDATNALQSRIDSTKRSVLTMVNDNIQMKVQRLSKSLDTNPNLLTGTANYEGNNWIHKDSWHDDGLTDPENNTALKHSNMAWYGLGQMIELEKGTYTFSAWMYTKAGTNPNSKAILFAGTGKDGETAQISKENGEGPSYPLSRDGHWERIEWTFRVVVSGKLYVRLELEQDDGTIQIASQKLEKGDTATRWCSNNRELVTVNDVVSSINLSPEEIKLNSNRIVLDGDTTIKDTLNVGNVILDGGNNGSITLGNGKVTINSCGDNYLSLGSGGVLISDVKNTSQVRIGKQFISLAVQDGMFMEMNGIGLAVGNVDAKTKEFKNSGILTSVTGNFSSSEQTPGIGLLIAPENVMGHSNGESIVIGEIADQNGNVHLGMDYKIANNFDNKRKGQFHWIARHQLFEDGGMIHPTSTSQDDLFITSTKIPHTAQENCYQPTLMLSHGHKSNGDNNVGSAGLQFQWDALVPFGKIQTSNFYLHPHGAQDSQSGTKGLAINWVQWSGWEERVPTIQRVNQNGKEMVNGGLAFFAWGGIVYWDGARRWNLDWALNHTDNDLAPSDHGTFVTHM